MTGKPVEIISLRTVFGLVLCWMKYLRSYMDNTSKLKITNDLLHSLDDSYTTNIKDLRYKCIILIGSSSLFFFQEIFFSEKSSLWSSSLETIFFFGHLWNTVWSILLDLNASREHITSRRGQTPMMWFTTGREVWVRLVYLVLLFWTRYPRCCWIMLNELVIVSLFSPFFRFLNLSGRPVSKVLMREGVTARGAGCACREVPVRLNPR